MSKLWRIHLFGDATGEDKNKARTYCIDNKIMAIGWPCYVQHDNIEEYQKNTRQSKGGRRKMVIIRIQ